MSGVSQRRMRTKPNVKYPGFNGDGMQHDDHPDVFGGTVDNRQLDKKNQTILPSAGCTEV